MRLLEAYKLKNENQEYLDNMSSCGKEGLGNFYGFRNTNFRYNKSYRNGFMKFKEVAGVPRNQWPLHPNNGQEIHKQYPLRMLATKLFSGLKLRDKENQVYEITGKGIIFNDYINRDYSESITNLLDYLFIADMHFMYENNYILSHTENILNRFRLYFSDATISNELKRFINGYNESKKITNLMRYKFFYMHSFLNDHDLLAMLNDASDEELSELADYVINNKINNLRSCFISKKYYSAGNYNPGMIYDDTITFYLTTFVLKHSPVSFNDFIEDMVNEYTSIIDRQDLLSTLKGIIFEYEEALFIVFENIFELDFGDIIEPHTEDESLEIDSTEEDQGRNKIDTSTKQGKRYADKLYQRMKPIARENANYNCELEPIQGCNYFTSKSTKENYVEVHHLVPREFALEFDKSLETLANYISICPSCHKRIHLAVDTERESLIRFLYNIRHERLKMAGIDLNVEELLGYNKLDIYMRYINEDL